MAATLAREVLGRHDATNEGMLWQRNRVSIRIGEEDVELVFVVPDARTLSLLALIVLFDDDFTFFDRFTDDVRRIVRRSVVRRV